MIQEVGIWRATNPALDRIGSRLFAIALAILLHAVFLTLLFQATLHEKRRIASSRELIWTLPLIRTHQAPREMPRRGAPADHKIVTAPIMPPMTAPLSSAPPPAFTLQELGKELNNCQLEKLASLPPDERAACMSLAPKMVKRAPDADLMGFPSQVKNEARWRSEMARAHSPVLLPCGGGRDVVCILGKIMDGSLSDLGDPKTWPIYQTKELAPEDFYKIEQAYAEWHKDHPQAEH